jgi:hypothetical protein
MSGGIGKVVVTAVEFQMLRGGYYLRRTKIPDRPFQRMRSSAQPARIRPLNRMLNLAHHGWTFRAKYFHQFLEQSNVAPNAV